MSGTAVQQAASWFARHRIGPLSDADALAFRNWLRAAPEHAYEWSRQEEVWSQLESVRDSPRLMALREAARARAGQQRAHRLAWRWGAGLAACVLLASFAWRSPVVDVVRANTSSALLAQPAHNPGMLPLVRDVSTTVGERALVQLADGSTVTLNTDSALHADFTGAERRVTLVRGEAYFEVAKNKERPFMVSAGERDVIAVGTAFGIRLQPKRVKIDLVEGKVRVMRHAAGNSPVVQLEAGTSLLADANAEDVIGPFSVERDMGWRNGRLIFQSERLGDVVAEVNRYSNQKIVLSTDLLSERRVSGVFDPSNAGNLARVLEGYGMVRIAAWDNSSITLAAP